MPGRDLARGTAPARRGAGCRSCRRGTRPAADRRRESGRGAARSRRRPRAPSTPGILVADGRGRLAQRRLAHVERNEARERARRPQRVEQQARLLRGARTELDERVGLGDLRDLVGSLGEDRALGARRVVLGEPGDLVEELRAAVVVEPLRRQLLRVRREAARTRRGAARRSTSSGSMWTSMVSVAAPRFGRLVPARWAQASAASRTPENAQRAVGGKKFRYVGRT